MKAKINTYLKAWFAGQNSPWTIGLNAKVRIVEWQHLQN